MAQVGNLVAEKSVTNAQFRTTLSEARKLGQRPTPVLLGVFTDGTRYMVQDQFRDAQFYLVTDLTAPSRTHNLLSATHPDTLASAKTVGDMISGQAPGWAPLAIGAVGRFMKSNGSLPVWDVIVRSDLPLGTVVNLKADETQVTGTVSNASAKSFVLAANTFSLILIETEFQVDGAANAAFDVTFQFTIAGAGVGNTRELRLPALGAGNIGDIDGDLKFSQFQSASATIAVKVTVVTGAATWKVSSLRVYGIL